MKKYVKAAKNYITIRATYSADLELTECPTLRSMTVKGADLKQTLMDAVDSLALPYLGLDWEDPDSFSIDDLIEAIQNNNTSRNTADGYAYLFYFEINGDAIIDNIGPEENY